MLCNDILRNKNLCVFGLLWVSLSENILNASQTDKDKPVMVRLTPSYDLHKINRETYKSVVNTWEHEKRQKHDGKFLVQCNNKAMHQVFSWRKEVHLFPGQTVQSVR